MADRGRGRGQRGGGDRGGGGSRGGGRGGGRGRGGDIRGGDRGGARGGRGGGGDFRGGRGHDDVDYSEFAGVSAGMAALSVREELPPMAREEMVAIAGRPSAQQAQRIGKQIQLRANFFKLDTRNLCETAYNYDVWPCLVSRALQTQGKGGVACRPGRTCWSCPLSLVLSSHRKSAATSHGQRSV